MRVALAFALSVFASSTACNCGDAVHGVGEGESGAGEGEGALAGGEGEGALAGGEGEGAGGEGEGAARVAALYLVVGANVPAGVASQIASRIGALAALSSLPVVTLAATDAIVGPQGLNAGPGSKLIAIGASTAHNALVSDAETGALPSEGYVLKSGSVFAANAGAVDAIVVDGPGVQFGAYALLEQLGFGFFHPLAPVVPASLPDPFPAVDMTTSPRWPVRNIHVHSMHPLEMAEMLNGWGAGDPNDDAGFTSRLPEWTSFLEWMLANGDNEVEWVLLEADAWSDFAQSDVRQARLKTLVDAAHSFGIEAGADVPIAESQQHTFRLLKQQESTVDAELADIDGRIDYLMAAGFDFISTENGTTEFTHADPTRMLAWMNEVAIHTDVAWGKKARIKAHCSTGQTADPLTDPDTGSPLNFNFLPELADARLGIMPHTVQIYGIGDPAPTYGNTDFEYMADFLGKMAGTRETIWHPETAYWVSYDVDVPLFLPIYAKKRLADLRELARREDAGRFRNGAHMDGQAVFSSGFEWGYWLNDVVAARSSWDPHLEAASDDDALRAILAPLARTLGAAGAGVVQAVVDTADMEDDVLIHGEVAGVAPSDIVRRSGIAYLEGVDAFDDLPELAAKLGVSAPVTQPDKLGLVEMRNPLHAAPSFTGEIDGLVDEMRDRFQTLSGEMDAATANVPANAAPLAADLDDSAHITALRARQVSGLYHYVDGLFDLDPTAHLAALADARSALDDAQQVVDERITQYRVPHDRIDGWRTNPTAYDFTYLWSVRTLYYWWRDEGKAVDAPASPCYLNIVNPADVALGEESLANTADVLREITAGGFLGDLGECLAAPSSEPTFPQDDLRSRP